MFKRKKDITDDKSEEPISLEEKIQDPEFINKVNDAIAQELVEFMEYYQNGGFCEDVNVEEEIDHDHCALITAATKYRIVNGKVEMPQVFITYNKITQPYKGNKEEEDLEITVDKEEIAKKVKTMIEKELEANLRREKGFEPYYEHIGSDLWWQQYGYIKIENNEQPNDF